MSKNIVAICIALGFPIMLLCRALGVLPLAAILVCGACLVIIAWRAFDGKHYW